MVWKAALGLSLVIGAPSAAFAQYSAYDPAQDPYAKLRTYTQPRSGDVFTVTAGEAIAESKTDRLSEGVALLDDAVSTKNGPSAPRGARLYRISTSRAYKACVKGSVECLIDDDGDGTFDRIAWNDMAGAKLLAAKARYEKLAEGIIMPPPMQGLERTILYQGAANGVLKLSYREFSDNMARAPFSEDISIQLDAKFPQQFAVKGLTFTIQSISGLGMKFTLDSIAPDKGWPDQLK